jgi:hypothetical protein
MAFALALGLGAPAAHAADTETAVAGAVILEPGTVEKLQDLRFGNIVPGASGGTVTVAPNGNVTTGGTVISAGGDIGSAEFRFTRQWYQLFVTYGGTSSPTITLYNINSPTDTMTVRNFTTDFTSFWQPLFQNPFTFHVGGTLDVAAGQQPGFYVGTFHVIVNNL